MKKIVIAAGTGFLGNVLVTYFADKADEIVVLTRGKASIKSNIRRVTWDAANCTGWETELENADVLINLAGKSVNCRYTNKNKREIMASRVNSTIVLNKAIANCKNPPKHWLNSSTATIYRHSMDRQMDEETGDIGSDFSMNVAKAWERAFNQTATPLTKKTALRTSIVLGKEGGAYIPLKNLARLGLGGRQGSGRQFISWVHELDFARAVEFIIQRQIQGAVNVVSPAPVRNAEFMKKLRKKLNAPFGIPTPEPLLRVGAKLIGTEPELVLKSRNVIPTRLIENGFTFRYNTLPEALEALQPTS